MTVDEVVKHGTHMGVFAGMAQAPLSGSGHSSTEELNKNENKTRSFQIVLVAGKFIKQVM